MSVRTWKSNGKMYWPGWNSFSEIVSVFCREGKNAGKPGPCPHDGGDNEEDDNSLGLVDVDSPEFKQWFGSSKVLDDYGDPIVTHHGTHAVFDDFEMPEHNVGGKEFGDGFYFTTQERYADYFAGDGFGDGNGRVVHAYLKVENPFVVNDRTFAKEARDFGGPEGYVKHLQREGYDGLRIDRYEPAIRSDVTEWVVFNNNQIKQTARPAISY